MIMIMHRVTDRIPLRWQGLVFGLAGMAAGAALIAAGALVAIFK